MRKLDAIIVVTILVLLAVNFLSSDVFGRISRGHRSTASVYIWRPEETGNWQSASSWTPPREKPAPSDVLIFDVHGTTTATGIPSQSIGQLVVLENTTLNLRSSDTAVLSILGGQGEDLLVERNGTLNLNGVNPLTISLDSNTTSVVKGSVTFSSSNTAAHVLTAVDEGAVVFERGATFVAGPGTTGHPFGTTNLSSVRFTSGSTYECEAGGDPFGALEPDSVVVFETGSLFRLTGDVIPSLSGRRYGNFEMDSSLAYAFVYGTSAFTMDDLKITAGKLALSLTGAGHSIRGDITISPGSRLEFQAPFPGATITLNGPSHQTITNRGGIIVIPGNTLAIDNAAGVTANGFIAWNLSLSNGILTVGDPPDYFRVPGTVTRGNGYVNGYLSRAINTVGAYSFDVGTVNGYSPVLVQVTAGDGLPSDIIVRAVEAPEPNIPDPSKALSRYWRIYGSPNITAANLTFSYLDPADLPTSASESELLIQRYRDGFSRPEGAINTDTNNFTVTGVTELSYANWTLAAASAFGTPTPTSSPTFTPTATPTATPVVGRRESFDYDADGKTDISVFRPSHGAWYVQRSTTGLIGAEFGFVSDRLAPADYNGDGKTEIAVYRPETGIWYVFDIENGVTSYYVFGLAEDLPVPADYDGDGRADVSVFRPSTGTWYRQNSSDGSFYAQQFGATGDKPVLGDYDSDGKADLSVFRPSTGAWYQIYSSDGSLHGEAFGFDTDITVQADYDGDGKTDIAVYRPSNGFWYIRNSNGPVYTAFPFGLSDDIPAPGDFDGDGRSDLSVFRPSDGIWYRMNSSNGGFEAYPFGTVGDRPTMTAFRY